MSQQAPSEHAPSPKSSQAVIFDLDGVLVDTEELALTTLQDTLQEQGIRRALDDLKVLCGQPKSALRSYLLACADGSEAEADRLAQMYSTALEARLRSEEAVLFPGAETLVRTLRQAGRRVGLATSSERRRAELELQGTGLLDVFDAVVAGDEVEQGKPHPEIYITAARRLGISEGNCTVIEDSVVGVEAARSAGMRVVAVTHTFGRSELGNADVVVESLDEAGDAVRKLSGKEDRRA